MLEDQLYSIIKSSQILNIKILKKLQLAQEIDLSPLEARLGEINTKLDTLDRPIASNPMQPKTLNITGSEQIIFKDFSFSFGYIYGIDCNLSCRIRAYTSSAARQFDLGRSLNRCPPKECIFDVVISKSTSDIKSYFLNPVAVASTEIIYLFAEILNSASIESIINIKYRE